MQASVKAMPPKYPTVEDLVGNTPLVRMQRLGTHLGRNNTILLKLEGDNPAGSVKDRPALSMITQAERAGRIRPGDTLIEATSGNTGTVHVKPLRKPVCAVSSSSYIALSPHTSSTPNTHHGLNTSPPSTPSPPS